MCENPQIFWKIIESLSKHLLLYCTGLFVLLTCIEHDTWFQRAPNMQNPLLHGVWTQMGVGSVWTHPHYNDTNPPTPHFLIPFNPSQSHTRSAVLTHRNVTSYFGRPSNGGWLTALSCYIFCPQRLRCPSFSPLSSRCNVFNVSQANPCTVFGCKNEHKSLHFLPTSELLRMVWALHLWD